METARRIDLDQLLARSEWVRSLARKLVIDEARADDLVQEVWRAALRSRGVHGTLEAWVRGVLRNTLSTERRGDQNRGDRERRTARPEGIPSAAEIVERADAQRWIAAELDRLPAPYRDVLILRFYEDLPPRHIARRLGLSVATVRTHLARGLERLRRRMDAEHGGRRMWCLALVPLAARAKPPAIAASLAFHVVAWTAVAAGGVVAVRALAPETARLEIGDATLAAADEVRREAAETPQTLPIADSDEVTSARRAPIAPVAPAMAAAPATGTLAITVRSSSDRRPLARAAISVAAREADRIETVDVVAADDGVETGALGTVDVQVPAGRSLVTHAWGANLAGGSDRTELHPLAPGEVRAVSLELPTELDVEFWGRAVDPNGAPIENHGVRILRLDAHSYGEGTAHTPADRQLALGEVTTDEDGLFFVRTASWHTPVGWIESDDLAPRLFEIGSGHETVERALEVTLFRPASLAVQVVDRAGLAVPNVEVELRTDVNAWLHPESSMGVSEDADLVQATLRSSPETFTCAELPPSVPFDVVVLRNGRRIGLRRDPLVLAPDEDRELVLGLEGRTTVTGVARYVDGTPAEGVGLRLARSSGYVHDYFFGSEAVLLETRTGNGGVFHVEGLDPDVWWIGPEGSDDLVPRITELHVAAGATHVALDLTIHRGAILRGVVVDSEGRPVTLAALSATKAENGRERYRQGSSRETGAFEIGPVEPGVWSVHAYGLNGVLLGPSPEVEVEAGGEEVVLRMTHGGRLRGLVVRADGQPVTASIRLALPGSENHWFTPTRRGSTGTFERSSLPVGTYVVRAWTEDGHYGELRGVELGAGETLEELRVEVHPGARLRITASSAGRGSGWHVLRGDEVVGLGGALSGRDAVTVAPTGPVTLEHWPWDDGAARSRIELDLEPGEERELVLP